MSIKNIGVIGIGFVGSAIKKSLEKNNFILNETLFIYDKYKKDIDSIDSIYSIDSIDNIMNTDIIFLCLPTPFDSKLETYNLIEIENTLNLLNLKKYQGICLIKSTITPNTSNTYSEKFPELKIIHNPEFLSANTAEEDFHNQSHVVLGLTKNILPNEIESVVNFYKEFYTDNITIISSVESEIMKLASNSFYSVKIQFFTEMFLLCNKLDCSYNSVRDSMIKNNWINQMHTNVPGSDGNISYGGLCFPKDTNALNEFMKKNNVLNSVLDSTIKERLILRQDNKNIYL